jgi:exodeoxyribonuclease VII large subunit
MQGDKTEESVIAALDRVFPHTGLFDVVVLIRGGGSTSELNSFDTYPLAAHCAQFPLPVITGIGHERDDTLVDMVAHTRMKTPTAVASFLIECMCREAARVQKMEKTVCDGVAGCIRREKSALQSLTAKLPAMVTGHIERHRSKLQTMTAYLSALPRRIQNRVEKIDELPSRLLRAVKTIVLQRTRTIELNEQFIKMVSPEYILKRGYTLTYKNGRIVKTATELSATDEITVKFVDGEKKGLII